MSTLRVRLLCAASVTVFAVTAGAAWAEDPKDQPNTVGEVVVTGVRASLRDALQAKKASAEIVETISSKDIGVLPDVTIAEELDRLPGINASRDRGNDSQASIRGQGPRLVLGLVNGREIASSEPDRNVRWEIFPSEAVGGVTVYKTQSADLIAGGVAGTIDIRSIRPLDYNGPALTMRAGPVYYDGVKLPNYNAWGYRASVEGVHKFNDDWGLAIGASYQSQKNGYDSFQGWGYNTPFTGNPPILNGVVTSTPWGAQTEVDELTENRKSVTASMQWRPSNTFQMNFDVLYSDVTIDENQYQAWYSRNGVWGDWAGNNANSWDPYYPGNGSSFTTINNVVVAANNLPWASVTNAIAHYAEDKNLLATGVNGVWTTGDWNVKADLSYSEAHRTNTWQSIFTEVYPSQMSFDTRAGVTPRITTSIDPANANNQFLASWQPGQSSGPEHINDNLGALSVDATRELHGDFFQTLQFGLRGSERIKQHDAMQYYEAPLVGQLPPSMLSEYIVKGFTVPPVLIGNFDQLVKIAYGSFSPNNPNAEGFVNPEQNYWRVHEQDVEGYVMTTFANDMGGTPMHGNAGVRFVSVNTHSDGFQSVNSGPLTAIDLSHNYTEVLPSVNLTFEVHPDLLFRLGAARTMSRPPLDEMRAGRTIFTTPPPSGSAGNPLLNPFIADQVDASLEWYFGKESLLAASVYYKNVESNIGYKTQPVVINGTSYNITGPFNGNGGTMDGIEFTFQTPFYFIPGGEHFGIYSNLALAGSTIKEFSPQNNPFPQVGWAKTTGEVDLWYNQAGFESRLGLKYHSPFTVIYGWDASQLTRLESETTLDFSASYQITPNYSVRFQAANLTNTVSRYYWNNDPNQIARYDRYGRRMLLDFTVKY
jgi:TonB-dependent receptor